MYKHMLYRPAHRPSTFIYMCEYIDIDICIYVYTCVCASICLFVYREVQRDIHFSELFLSNVLAQPHCYSVMRTTGKHQVPILDQV